MSFKVQGQGRSLTKSANSIILEFVSGFAPVSFDGLSVEFCCLVTKFNLFRLKVTILA